MKLTTKFLAVAMVFTMGSAMAQAPVAAPAKAQPTPPSAEMRAGIKQMLDAMNFKQALAQVSNMMAQNLPNMMDQMLSNDKSVTPEVAAEVKKSFEASKPKVMNEFGALFADPEVLTAIEEITTRVYARHFALEEVNAITTFYTSAAGKKMTTMASQLMLETMPQIMGVISPKMNALVDGYRKELAAKAAKNAEAAPSK